ncbi:hypothetical protein L873DRAFT_1805665 [Choiromyces venosus 120613-1]|uniref:Uncharacterized protein n=1 Tax=Choiromyces venosus 120613-1 TaxID=1336337 RepID=A0A3N4JPK7_9PEZI|nr:hypothetical protein L873DRAFT_1805665 [Choiromyces venosus 120613-1]
MDNITLKTTILRDTTEASLTLFVTFATYLNQAAQAGTGAVGVFKARLRVIMRDGLNPDSYSLLKLRGADKKPEKEA